MKTVILAGGFGTRLSEETQSIPKPMVKIGGKPMLWHIMNIYAAFDHRDFIVACGYKGEIIKDYFGAFTSEEKPNWRVNCVDTGLHSMTGGRLLRLRSLLKSETFMVTYGDGLADLDISALLAFHRRHGQIGTVTAVQPSPRFGALHLDASDRVKVFDEKLDSASGWINGGFFVFEPGILDYIDSIDTPLETIPLSRLAADGNLMAYRHSGFWKPMDTLREKNQLNELWDGGNAPWKIW